MKRGLAACSSVIGNSDATTPGCVMLRYHSIEDALTAVGAAAAVSGCRLVVSWEWWDALPEADRQAYRVRCEALNVRLLADHRISRHFVEVSDADEPRLSSEHGA